jgi:hypothetical protein
MCLEQLDMMASESESERKRKSERNAGEKMGAE